MYKTKETVIKHLENGANFETKAFEVFRDDRDVVIAAVKMRGDALRIASERLQAEKEVVSQQSTSLSD